MQAKKEYKLYCANPELTRNIWQELTLQRLLVIPIILFLLFMLTKYSVTEAGFPKRLTINSFIAFVLVGFFWGIKQVNDSLAEEFTNGTWDSQRMSGLSAMQLVMGKLFGGAIIVWYILFFLLGAFVYANMLHGKLSLGLTVQWICGLVFLTIVAHGLTLSSLLAVWRKQDHQATKNIRFAIVIPILGSGIFTYICVAFFMEAFRYGVPKNADVNWFFCKLNLFTVFLVAILSMACWVIIGTWQQMRSELRFSTKPWWWLGFLVFWMIFLAGFMNNDLGSFFSRERWKIYTSICLTCVVSTVYLQIFFAPKDSMFWLRFLDAFKQKNTKAIGNLFPAWLTSFIVMLVLAVALIVMIVSDKNQEGLYFVIALVFFVLRDVLLAVWLNLSKGAKRADAAWVFYLLVLYLLLPGLVSQVFSSGSEQLFLPYLPSRFSANGNAWFILSPIIQAIVMMVMVSMRWRKNTEKR